MSKRFINDDNSLTIHTLYLKDRFVLNFQRPPKIWYNGIQTAISMSLILW